jgi:hypothetical protein
MSEFGVLRLDKALTMHFSRQDVRFRQSDDSAGPWLT